ncbi:50S ribosomal protein L23 [soil metagenome]
MSNVHDFLIRPIVTEKSTDLMESANAYTFIVARDANKIQIANAVRQQFGVEVLSVQTMRYRGKERRVGRRSGRRAEWKKAIVSIPAGAAIEIFEGV